MTQVEAVSDESLKKAVADELSWTPNVNSTHIGIAVNLGAVTLSGEVENYPEKLRAQEAALRVHGVTAIADEITVRRALGEPNDTDIAREAARALDHAVDVPPDSVKVTVHDHVVHLTGKVGWHFEREAAARAVRYLKGVTGVQNRIAIKPAPSTSNIKTAITAALVRNAQLEGSNITVESTPDGTVRIEGQVDTWAARKQAEQLAWSAPGVTAVTNHLKVKP